MARPQARELYRSGRTPALEPDNVASRLQARTLPQVSGDTGPVPDANQPGHHPVLDQDKPDMDDFVDRFRTPPTSPDEGADAHPDTSSSTLHTLTFVYAATVVVLCVFGVVLWRRRR